MIFSIFYFIKQVNPDFSLKASVGYNDRFGQIMQNPDPFRSLACWERQRKREEKDQQQDEWIQL